MGAALAKAEYYSYRCPSCDVVCVLTMDFESRRRNDGRDFYCPNGHFHNFSAAKNREESKLREELASAQSSLASEIRRRELAETAAKGANIAAGRARAAHRRLHERVAAGVCPCCHRTFKQLAAHMKAKHPEASK